MNLVVEHLIHNDVLYTAIACGRKVSWVGAANGTFDSLQNFCSPLTSVRFLLRYPHMS